MEKIKNNIPTVILICISIILIAIISVMSYFRYESKKHYFPMQRYEVTCLTNAVYKLSGNNATDTKRQNIAYQILNQRGNTQFENNVVDVLESHPELYGTWGEDDIQKPQDTNQEQYEKAQAAVENIIVSKRIPIVG